MAVVTAVPWYSICVSAGKQQPDFPTEKVFKPLKHIRLYNEHSLHQQKLPLNLTPFKSIALGNVHNFH